MSEPLEVPKPPVINQDDLNRCRASNDYRPVLFEWYSYVGLLCNFYASIRIDSPGLRRIPHIYYYVLVGLLNRCARLMLANVALSHGGLFGETTAIIDRCIFESAVKIAWLCAQGDDESFTRLIADGLRTELEFQKKIEENVTNRGGTPLLIETRMLSSIHDYVSSASLSEGEILSAKKLPDLAAMIEALNRDRLLYIVGQKIGSHHVHGTWPSLLLHYLEQGDDGMLRPRDHDCPTHVNQYVFIPLIVLNAMDSFVRFVCPDLSHVKAFSGLLESVREEIHRINSEVVGNDFERIQVI